MPDPQPRGAVRTWLRRLAPWGIAAGLLAYVFHLVPVDRAVAALQSVGAAPLLGLGVAYFLIVYAADAVATWATLRWCGAPLAWWELVRLRGATYLLAIIHYNVGQGGLAYAIGRRPGVGLARASGMVLLMMAMMLVDVLLVALVSGVLFGATDHRLQLVRGLAAVGLGIFVLYLGVVAWSPGWLTRRALLQPLFAAGVVGHLKVALVRLPHVLAHIFFQWLFLRLFGIALPLTQAAVLLPAVMVIASLPITVQGLGTKQLASIVLLAPYFAGDLATGEARVVSCSLSVVTLAVIFSLLVGLICLSLGTARREEATEVSP